MRITTIAAAAALAVSAAASAEIVTVNVDGVQSWDAFGDPDNVFVELDLAAALGLPAGSDVVIDGVGWDVTIDTVGDSWLSEAVVGLDDGDGTYDLFLNPSAGDDFPGNASYSSGGILDLEDDLGLGDVLVSGGILTLQVYESFDDVADEVDAVWAGEFQLNVIPGPGALALLGLAGLAGSRRRRG